ncbi:MAG: acyltransferase [Candidatus Micrarchaeota archaeon]|nr:acyltransferase [Candidatus Micrarchaeota archaeon]
MRKVKIFKCQGNSLLLWWKVRNPLRIACNFVLIYAARFLPSLALKNFFYRLCGAKIGKNVAFGLGATLDIFFPELIEVEDGAIVGYNTVILTHEFLQGSFRIGKVKIGKGAMVGANCTILPGVQIGEGASISAMSLVNKDVPPKQVWGGVPAKCIR